MIAHIVLFSPKPDLDSALRRAFAQAILDTCSTIPQVKRAIVGRSAEIDPGYARSFGEKTYDYAAVLEFDSQADLVAYLTHPAHRRLGQLFWESCASTVIMEVEFSDAKAPQAIDLLV